MTSPVRREMAASVLGVGIGYTVFDGFRDGTTMEVVSEGDTKVEGEI